MSNGIMNLAFENEDGEVVTVAEVVGAGDTDVEQGAADPTDFVDAPEVDEVQAEEQAGEFEATAGDMDAAADAAEVLEETAEAVEETIPEGGLSEGAAKAIEVSVESLLLKVGFSAKHAKALPAMEGFKNAGTRATKTKLAVESFKEKAIALWRAIVAAFQKAVEHVKNFLDLSGRQAAGLAKRADELAKKSASLKGAAKIKEISGEKLLSADGKLLSGSNLVSAYKKHASQIAGQENRIARLNGVVEDVKKAMEGGSVDTDPMKFFGVGKDGKIAQNPSFTIADNQKAFEMEFALGGKSLFTILPVANDEAKAGGAIKFLASLRGAHAKIADATDAKKVEGGKVAVLDPREIGDLCKEVAAHMKTYEGLTKAVSEAKSAANKLAQEVSKFSREGADDAAKDEASAKAKAVSAAINAATNVLMGGAIALRKFDIAVAKASLTQAAKSVRAYEGKAEEPAAEPAAA